MSKRAVTNGLRWEFRQGLSILRDGDDRVLDMRNNKKGSARIISGTDRWAVYNHGFWNPRLVVTHNGKSVAVVDGYVPGSAARVELAGGHAYDLDVRISPTVRVSLLKLDGGEIMRYAQLQAWPKPRANFEVFDQGIPYQELLLLVVLGCHAFLCIQMELGDTRELSKPTKWATV